MFVLDTNHVSDLTYRAAAGLRLLQKLDAVDQDTAVTAITVEESLRGWLVESRRRTDPRTQIAAYQRLTRQVEVFASWLVLPWDDDAADSFDSLKSLRQTVHPADGVARDPLVAGFAADAEIPAKLRHGKMTATILPRIMICDLGRTGNSMLTGF